MYKSGLDGVGLAFSGLYRLCRRVSGNKTDEIVFYKRHRLLGCVDLFHIVTSTSPILSFSYIRLLLKFVYSYPNKILRFD